MKTSDDSTCNHEAARLLPWFVAGTLSARDSTNVQAHLQECRLCAADERRERHLRTLIHGESTVEHAPQPGLQKLMSRIDELERELPVQPSMREHTAFRPPRRPAFIRWLVAAALVQAIGLGVLGLLLWQTSQLQAPRFSTLTSPAPSVGSGVPHVRVVFTPTMTTGEVQSLLTSLEATIVAGPSEAGVYTLALQDKQQSIEAVLTRLRATQGVLFAEPQLPLPSGHAQ